MGPIWIQKAFTRVLSGCMNEKVLINYANRPHSCDRHYKSDCCQLSDRHASHNGIFFENPVFAHQHPAQHP